MNQETVFGIEGEGVWLWHPSCDKEASKWYLAARYLHEGFKAPCRVCGNRFDVPSEVYEMFSS